MGGACDPKGAETMVPIEVVGERVTLDRMAHYGFAPEQIEDALTQTHESSGCTFENWNWVCESEEGTPNHAWKDSLDETAEFVMWVLEHPAIRLIFRGDVLSPNTDARSDPS